MNYFVTDHIDPTQQHAGPKARTDAERIMAARGYAPLTFDSAAEAGGMMAKRTAYRRCYQQWNDQGAGDLIMFQFPIPDVIPQMMAFPRRGGKTYRTVALIHDLDSVRFPNGGLNNLRALLSDKCLLPRFDYYISHNASMTQLLISWGIPAERIVDLGLFDYFLEGQAQAVAEPPYSIVYAGCLDITKCAFIPELPSVVQHHPISLYGLVVGELPTADHLHYVGSFPPGQLARALQGSFGLVWDGTTTNTCDGRFGQYLRYNNPHKFSLYLAAGLPVIAWSQSALAPLVRERGCGILVDSLAEVDDVLDALSPENYQQMLANAQAEGALLRQGARLNAALDALEQRAVL